MILIPLSDHPFYLWQALVQMYALRDQQATWLVYSARGRPSGLLREIMDANVANIVNWPDWPRDRTYNPSMKPWLVSKWLNDTNWSGPVQVIDPDVIPTGRPLPEAKDKVLYGTLTDWYTGPKWLDSKNALSAICYRLSVDKEKTFNYPGIGAQYIFSGIPGDWWEYVAQESIKIYKFLTKHPVDAQPWCAEMYVTHLVAIRDGYNPTPMPEMDMTWANGPSSGWKTTGYFHDAGITKKEPGVFYKGGFQGWPHTIPPVDPNQAAYHYVELINETEKTWPNLVSKFPRR